MPVSAIPTATTARNGVGAFIHQCKRLEFHYCDWAGSSRGMNLFLQHLLAGFAKRSPTITMHVSPRPNKHPVIRAHYVNGTSRAICVRNLEQDQILNKAQLLRDASGMKAQRIKGSRMVRSINENVRGIWSPMHANELEGGDVWDTPKKRPKNVFS